MPAHSGSAKMSRSADALQKQNSAAAGAQEQRPLREQERKVFYEQPFSSVYTAGADPDELSWIYHLVPLAAQHPHPFHLLYIAFQRCSSTVKKQHTDTGFRAVLAALFSFVQVAVFEPNFF